MTARMYVSLSVAVLLLTLTGSGQAQYYAGYGTGPVNLNPYPRPVRVNDPDLEAARAAAAFAVQFYGPSVGVSNYIEDVEPVYKYVRPNFASYPFPYPYQVLAGTAPPPVEATPVSQVLNFGF